MRLADSLRIVEQASVTDLRSLTRDELMYILAGMNPDEVQAFLFAKNVKIFGGINGYIDDFFRQETVGKTLQFPPIQRIGTIAVLTTMSAYPGVTKKNKERVLKGLAALQQTGGAKEDQIVHCLSQLKRFAPCIQAQPLRAYQFFYNLGRLQELVGDTEHPERWWKPIEALVEKGKYSELSSHIDSLKDYLKIEYDIKTIDKGC
jgi:hypothetical protein